MAFNLLAYPIVVQKQSAEPAIVSGRFWLDTDDGKLYYCDGSNYIDMTATENSFTSSIMENALEILQIQATQTLTATDSANIVSDVYSDANGYRDTIATGSTTATKITGAYANYFYGTSTTGGTLGSANAQTGKVGYKFKITAGGDVISLTKSASDSSTKAYIQTAYASGIVATATFSGNVATFSTPYTLTANTEYWILCDAEGGSRNRAYQASFPGNISSNGGVFVSEVREDGAADGNYQGLISAQIQSGVGVTALMQTAVQTITAGYTNFQIFTFGETLGGTGDIDYDISLNNGVNYQTAINANTATAITNAGTQLILKQNLKEGASGGTAEAKGYGVLLW